MIVTPFFFVYIETSFSIAINVENFIERNNGLIYVNI